MHNSISKWFCHELLLEEFNYGFSILQIFENSKFLNLTFCVSLNIYRRIICKIHRRTWTFYLWMAKWLMINIILVCEVLSTQGFSRGFESQFQSSRVPKIKEKPPQKAFGIILFWSYLYLLPTPWSWIWLCPLPGPWWRSAAGSRVAGQPGMRGVPPTADQIHPCGLNDQLFLISVYTKAAQQSVAC